MTNAQKTKRPKLPTTRESLAKIGDALSRIANMMQAGLFDLKGDSALEAISYALFDIAEYGAGKVPKEEYAWRHNRTEGN